MKIIFRALSVIFFLIFAFSLFAILFAIYNGTAESIILFFKMLTRPDVIMTNIGGALITTFRALIQFLIISIFYFIGRFFWKKSKNDLENNEPIEKIEPNFKI